MPKALDYLIGEKFLNFLVAADDDIEFRVELSAFVAEIKTIFEPWQLAEYLEKARQTQPFDPDIYEDDDDIELERQLDLRRNAADLLLVERAKEWLLGGSERTPEIYEMPRISAGLLMYRIKDGIFQVLLAHPGGPFFKNKDDDAWTIPKGEIDPGEEILSTALREFEEETGLKPQPPFVPLKPIQQKGGKIVHAWAFVGDCDPTAIKSNLVTMEWPAGSGRKIQFPEIDRAEFFDLDVARKKIKAAQATLIDELDVILKSD